MKRKWYYSETFHIQFYFDMFYALKSSETDETERRTGCMRRIQIP